MFDSAKAAAKKFGTRASLTFNAAAILLVAFVTALVLGFAIAFITSLNGEPNLYEAVVAGFDVDQRTDQNRDRLEQLCHLGRRRWSHLCWLRSGRCRLIRNVVENPGPTLRLRQGSVERRVDPPHGSNSKRLAIGTTRYSDTGRS